jgi:hypothetical protein
MCVDGEMAVKYDPPEVGSDGNLIGFGLLIVLVGVTMDIGVELVSSHEVEETGTTFGLISSGLMFNFDVLSFDGLSFSKSDSQSETFSLHCRSMSSQMTY